MKAYKFKLYNSKKNKKLHSLIALSAEIYNHCIALYKRYYAIYKKHIHVYQIQKHITRLKRQKKYKHWKNLNSQSIQDIVERIDKAYKLFFRNIKHKIKTNPPSFKKRSKYKSFTLKQTGWKLFDNKIKIGKQIFKYFKSREIEGSVKTITIKRDSLGDIYIFIVTDVKTEVEFFKQGKSSEGFDFGLKTFLTISDGNKIESPEFFKKGICKIKYACKKLSRKKKGSHNRYKAKLNLARKHKKIANQRQDCFFKLSHQLCLMYENLYFETLNLKGMKKLWGRKISDLSFGEFLEILEYISLKHNSKIVYIPQYYPSSKTCSNCLCINEELSLKDRTWICKNCNTEHDRDFNASVNIKRVGTSTLGVEDVRPSNRQSSLIPESKAL